MTEVKDVNFCTEHKVCEIDEYLRRITIIYTNACYIAENFRHWFSEVDNELRELGLTKDELTKRERKLEEKEQELNEQKDELFLKEKNIRTADAATCVNINKLINKTEDILNNLKDEKEKMKLFEGNMYTNNKQECDGNKEECDVGEVSKKQKVLTIVVMVVFLGLLGFVLCVK